MTNLNSGVSVIVLAYTLHQTIYLDISEAVKGSCLTLVSCLQAYHMHR